MELGPTGLGVWTEPRQGSLPVKRFAVHLTGSQNLTGSCPQILKLFSVIHENARGDYREKPAFSLS